MYCPPTGWTFNTQIRGGYTTYNSLTIVGNSSDGTLTTSQSTGPMLAFSQTLGYKEAFSLRLTGRGALSYTNDHELGQLDGYIANAEALLSVPFLANHESSLIFMPSIGFGWVQIYDKLIQPSNAKQLNQARFFAPSAGLLVSFMPAAAVTIKGGIFFSFPIGKNKYQLTDPDDPTEDLDFPYSKLRRRRHGMNAELEMAYKINTNVSIVTKGEWNTLSVQGDIADFTRAFYRIEQYAVSMGVNFCY